MTAAALWLLRVGMSGLQLGAMLWLAVILVLAVRTGGWRRLTGWSISGQFAELGRLIRLAGEGGTPRLLTRIASWSAAAGTAALLLAGLLALLDTFASR